MLRKLTGEQISDWFTIGKAVTAVEFLGEEAQAGALRSPPCRSPGPLAAREPLTAAGLPITGSVGTEYAEKYRQAEAQELDVVGNDQLVYKPGTSLYQCESSDWTSIPITNHKSVDMPIAKHREEVSVENISTKETRLLYMTTGVLLQKIVCAKSLAEFTHIFIDEVHERTEEMDFLLLVIRKLLRTNSQSVKVSGKEKRTDCVPVYKYCLRVAQET